MRDERKSAADEAANEKAFAAASPGAATLEHAEASASLAAIFQTLVVAGETVSTDATQSKPNAF